MIRAKSRCAVGKAAHDISEMQMLSLEGLYTAIHCVLRVLLDHHVGVNFPLAVYYRCARIVSGRLQPED